MEKINTGTAALAGQTIGRWKVSDEYVCMPNGEKKRKCICECGTERYVSERSLRYNKSLSCGCLRRKRTSQVFRPELTDRRVHSEEAVPQKKYAFTDITGQRFQQLTALYPTKQRSTKGSVIWHCRCDCGNEVDVSYNELAYSPRISCGCQKKRHDRKLREHLTHVAGTSLDILKSKKVPTDNTTGCKGVYLIRGKYVAKIVFQKKAYYLGTYDNIEEAAEARREAEETLFDGFADFYQKWKESADADPDWAKRNPIEVLVGRDAEGHFQIRYCPEGIGERAVM